MRKLLAKIFLTIGVAILFTHQFTAHHHHDDVSTTSYHHLDHKKDYEGLPPHFIDHVFSNGKTATTDLARIAPVEIFLFCKLVITLVNSEHSPSPGYLFVDTGPPKAAYFQYVTRRGPPAC